MALALALVLTLPNPNPSPNPDPNPDPNTDPSPDPNPDRETKPYPKQVGDSPANDVGFGRAAGVSTAPLNLPYLSYTSPISPRAPAPNPNYPKP